MQHDIGVFYTGKVFCLPGISVQNPTRVTTTDVLVELKEIPDGLIYNSSSPPRGVWDEVDLLWNVGSLAPLEKLTLMLCFEITDPTKSSFNFYFRTNYTDFCEVCTPFTDACISVTGITKTELINSGFVFPVGIYDDDLDAASGGVLVGQYYELSATNTLGLPEGHIKRRTV